MHINNYIMQQLRAKCGLVNRKGIGECLPSKGAVSACIREFWGVKRKGKNFGNYSVVVPRNVSERKHVPPHIKKPLYSETSLPPPSPWRPEIKSDHQIQKMRESCILARKILDTVGQEIKAGITTDEIDIKVHKLAIENGAYPSPLNYHGFPKSTCTSVNNVACHGIPDDRPLEDGDIINVDITVYLNGYHGDCSSTYLVGNVDDAGKDLVAATEKCLLEAINVCKPGVKFYEIGNCIEELANKDGFNVVPAFTGHGIGSYFHGAPEILHFTNYNPGRMEAGMTFTIEPILTQGSKEIVLLEDGWTACTLDNARTAQFEHTVLITETGTEILT